MFCLSISSTALLSESQKVRTVLQRQRLACVSSIYPLAIPTGTLINRSRRGRGYLTGWRGATTCSSS